jgi:hypothetical protein
MHQIAIVEYKKLLIQLFNMTLLKFESPLIQQFVSTLQLYDLLIDYGEIIILFNNYHFI